LPPPIASPWSAPSSCCNCDFSSSDPSSAADFLDLKGLTGDPMSKPLSTFQAPPPHFDSSADMKRVSYGAREVIRRDIEVNGTYPRTVEAFRQKILAVDSTLCFARVQLFCHWY
ncbi:NADPH:quinone oxidoreductase, partial [Striga asiatica]